MLIIPPRHPQRRHTDHVHSEDWGGALLGASVVVDTHLKNRYTIPPRVSKIHPINVQKYVSITRLLAGT